MTWIEDPNFQWEHCRNIHRLQTYEYNATELFNQNLSKKDRADVANDAYDTPQKTLPMWISK